jgi:hypothetical protein
VRRRHREERSCAELIGDWGNAARVLNSFAVRELRFVTLLSRISRHPFWQYAECKASG